MGEWLTVALPKGRLGEKVYKLFAKAGYECEDVLADTRQLIFENEAYRSYEVRLKEYHRPDIKLES